MTNAHNRPDVRLQNVVKTYDTGEQSFTALHDIAVSVPSGEFVAVVGKLGSGKTTLLNVLAGIDRPTRGKTGGYGLGLSIAKRIVEAHGGTISVHNNANRGASFTVTLPTRHESRS